jgi:glucans biosynthesis protein
VERPAPDAKALVLYALLDSKSMTGAYRFVLRPGRDTATDVSARLFPREQGHKIGMAPLTSMYFYGENQGSARNDYRPEVHDSDGLSIHSATGEWIWRPLQNPKRLLVTSFMLTDPKGFGLMQRDRAFSSYEDLDHRYDLHPSAWVEPRGRWGKGRVELVQIPTPDATNENIVAYWVPADPLPKPQQAYDFEYRITWQKASPSRPPLAWVVQTRRGEGRDAAGKADNTIVFVIDFTKTTLPSRPEQSPPDGIVSLDGNGELLGSIVRRNDVTGGWRLTLRIRQIDVKKPVEARAVLRYKNTTVSETWSYILPPG